MIKQELKELFEYRLKMRKSAPSPREIELLVRLIDKAEEQICSVDDELARTALRKRYIMCMKWDEIADEFGYYSSDAIRKLCDRAIRSLCREERYCESRDYRQL